MVPLLYGPTGLVEATTVAHATATHPVSPARIGGVA